MIRPIALILFLLLSLGSLLADDLERDPINYSKAIPNNIISQFKERLGSGKSSISHDDDTGYLKGVLKELKIPLSSQVLVFFQNQHATLTHYSQDSTLAVFQR